MDNVQGAQITHHAMGTVMTHKVFGLYAEDSLMAAYSEIARIEARRKYISNVWKTR